jgi:hypothetical protein
MPDAADGSATIISSAAAGLGKGGAPGPGGTGAPSSPAGTLESGGGAFLNKALAMAARPGWKTTELWFLVAVAALAQWMVAHGHASGDFANALSFVSAGIYLYFRQVHKADIFGQAAAAAQAAAQAAAPTISTAAELEAAVGRQLAAHQQEIIGLLAQAGADANREIGVPGGGK